MDVRGEPPPTMTWSFNGKPLINGRSVKIENEDYNTKFSLSDTTRKNTGVYSLRAENASGFDEATAEVIILGNTIYFNDLNRYSVSDKVFYFGYEMIETPDIPV